MCSSFFDVCEWRKFDWDLDLGLILGEDDWA